LDVIKSFTKQLGTIAGIGASKNIAVQDVDMKQEERKRG
jgi:hypothetical protein